ncbi:MAG: oligosaccharide flippase family protein, partial [Saprospiraceae bacterium]
MTDISPSDPVAPGNRYWLRSGLLTLLEKGAGLVFSLGTSVLLYRLISQQRLGTWEIFLIVTYFLEMGRLGLVQNGLVRFLSVNRQHSSQYPAIVTSSLIINLGFSLVSNVVLWLLIGWLSRSYQAPELGIVLPVYFVTNFVMAWLYHCNFVQQANLEFRGIFWSTFCFRGALFGWVLFCKISGIPIELWQLATAMLVGASIGALFTWRFAAPFLRHTARVDWEWIKKLLAFGKFVFGTNLSTIFYKNVDKLILGKLLDPAAIAIYGVAGRITQMVETPSFSIAAVVFPQSAGRLERDGLAGVKWLYERSVGAILAIVLPFVVLVLLFAEPMVWVFAGDKYQQSVNLLRLTAFFGLFLPFAVQFGTILDSTGRPAVNFAYTLFTAVINLVLSYLFVLEFGLFGAAFATLTGYTISFFAMQRLLRRDFDIRWWAAFAYVPE